MKRVLVLVFLSCLCVVGCKSTPIDQSTKRSVQESQIDDQMAKLRNMIDDTSENIQQLRKDLTHMSEAEYEKAVVSLTAQMDQLHDAMEKMNSAVVDSSQKVKDEVTHFWEGSLSTMNRAIALMSESMNEMKEMGIEKGREGMHLAIDNMSSALHSMQNNLDMMKKKMEKVD